MVQLIGASLLGPLLSPGAQLSRPWLATFHTAAFKVPAHPEVWDRWHQPLLLFYPRLPSFIWPLPLWIMTRFRPEWDFLTTNCSYPGRLQELSLGVQRTLTCFQVFPLELGNVMWLSPLMPSLGDDVGTEMICVAKGMAFKGVQPTHKYLRTKSHQVCAYLLLQYCSRAVGPSPD